MLKPFPLSQGAAADDLFIELNEKLEQFYCLLDVNGDGKLTHEDFERACGRPNLMLLTQARHSHHPHSAAWRFESLRLQLLLSSFVAHNRLLEMYSRSLLNHNS